MKLLLLATLLTFVSCAKQGTSVVPDGAKDDFGVTLLFTQDGCSVYRFQDGGYMRYFTNCKGQTISTVSCGKNCTRQENI